MIIGNSHKVFLGGGFWFETVKYIDKNQVCQNGGLWCSSWQAPDSSSSSSELTCDRPAGPTGCAQLSPWDAGPRDLLLPGCWQVILSASVLLGGSCSIAWKWSCHLLQVCCVPCQSTWAPVATPCPNEGIWFILCKESRNCTMLAVGISN